MQKALADSPILECVEEHSFEQAKQAVCSDDIWLDRLLFGVTWVLGRNPEWGEPTDNPMIWAATAAPLLGLPELVIYYWFDDVQVHLVSIEPAIPETGEYDFEDIEF